MSTTDATGEEGNWAFPDGMTREEYAKAHSTEARVYRYLKDAGQIVLTEDERALVGRLELCASTNDCLEVQEAKGLLALIVRLVSALAQARTSAESSKALRLRVAAQNVMLAWAGSWDCSANPGHPRMDLPFSELEAALDWFDEPCECGDPRRDHPNDGPCSFDTHHIPDRSQDRCMKYRSLRGET